MGVELVGNQVTFTGDGADDSLYLRTSTTGTLEYSTTGAEGSYLSDLDVATPGVQQIALTSAREIYVNLADGDDQLILDGLLNTFLASSGSILTFDGGAGTDTLTGPSQANAWVIEGADSGRLNDRLVFQSIENLIGGTGGADRFTFRAGGSVSGLVQGQIGDLDEIVVELHVGAMAQTFAYSDGLVKLNDATLVQYTDVNSPQNLVLHATSGNDLLRLGPGAWLGQLILQDANATPAFQPVIFDQPGDSLTIAMGEGNDQIAFLGDGLSDALTLLLLGGAGSDQVLGPASENTWTISETNGGTLNTNVGFQGIEGVTGAAGYRDVFDFLAGGCLDGSVVGQSADGDQLVVELEVGAVAQSLSFTSGRIDLNSSPLTQYLGLADVQNVVLHGTDRDDQLQLENSAGSWVLRSLDSSLQPITLVQPPQNSLRVAAGDGDDSIRVKNPGNIGPLTIDGEDGDDRLIVDLAADASTHGVNLDAATAGAGQIVIDSRTMSYVGVEDPQNLVLRGTTAADTMQLRSNAAGGLVLESLDSTPTFGTLSFGVPTGSLAILGGAGDDSLTIASSVLLAAPLTVDGQAGNDSLSLGGTLSGLTFGASTETVSGTATIGDLTFEATSAADAI